MLDVPPGEPRWASWGYVALGSLVIFLTVPFARALQSLLAEHAGRTFVFYIVGIAALVGAALAVRSLRRRCVGATAYAWITAVVAAFAWYAYILRDNPEETIHFVEYGLLSLLVFRALVHQMRDVTIYFAGVLVIGIIGIIDEWIQWIVPSRYWDLRDVQINLVAGALTQIAIATGLRPRLVSGWPSAVNIARLSVIGVMMLFLLGLSYANTPQRIALYASRVPLLSFLLSSKSMMVEYGYLYDDPDIGVFRSRFTLEELELNDAKRGEELAQAFDIYINDARFGEFQEVYSVPRDAYIHEAGIHLFRRNRYLEIATQEERRRFLHYNIAHRENQILEKYFPTGLNLSSHVWTDATKSTVAYLADKEPKYESRVSRDLITRASESQVLMSFGAGILILLGVAAFCYRRRDELNSGQAQTTGDNT
ncbi:MAG: VanZ family protein [Gammaproteobacteria bacterium]|nr:VanZ family protein [Gammaproteobacteria bacterium]